MQAEQEKRQADTWQVGNSKPTLGDVFALVDLSKQSRPILP